MSPSELEALERQRDYVCEKLEVLVEHAEETAAPQDAMMADILEQVQSLEALLPLLLSTSIKPTPRS